MDEIALPNSADDVTRQILSLLPTLGKENNNLAAQSKVSWVWNTMFVALDNAKTMAKATAHQQHLSSTTHLHHLSFSTNVRDTSPICYGPLNLNMFWLIPCLAPWKHSHPQWNGRG
jgi:hypothetical protein